MGLTLVQRRYCRPDVGQRQPSLRCCLGDLYYTYVDIHKVYPNEYAQGSGFVICLW